MADIPDTVRAGCLARDDALGGGCYHCGRRAGPGQRHLHHRLPGGPSVPSNLIRLWPGCHINLVHGRRDSAPWVEGGWLGSSGGRVWVQGIGWVVLDDEYGWAPVIGDDGSVPVPPRCVTAPRSLF